MNFHANSGFGASIVDSSITNAHLQDNSVDTSKIQDGAVTLDKVDFTSTTDALVIPSMTEAQRDAISTPEQGMVLINTTTSDFNFYDNSAWKSVSGSAGGLGPSSVETTNINDDAVTVDKIDLSSTTEGLTFANMTNAQRDAIAAPADGMMIYNTDSKMMEVYSDGVWTGVGGTSVKTIYTDVVAGSRFSCALRSDQQVDCWGINSSGELGNNTITQSNKPVQVYVTTGELLDNVVQLETGNHSTCAVKNDGTIWCWGYNGYGQLGINNTTNQLRAKKVNTVTTAVKVAGGARHFCALNSAGNVYCWGTGTSGQLGNNGTGNSFVPVLVSISNVRDIGVGSGMACAIKTDDTLWCWGRNNLGQLGLGDTTNRLLPVQSATDVKQFDAGTENANWNTTSCYVKNDGTLWCAGYNGHGQLGIDATGNQSTWQQVQHDTNGDGAGDGNLTSVDKVRVGAYAVCAVKTDKTVWCTGLNSEKHLNDGTTTNRDVAIQANASNVVDIALGEHNGSYHAVYALTDGTVWSVGNNGNGQIGDNSTTNRGNLKKLYTEPTNGEGGVGVNSIVNSHIQDESITDTKLSGLTTGCPVGQSLKMDGLGNFYCWNPDEHSLDSADGSVPNAVFVENTGNVGVGSVTPSFKLDVSVANSSNDGIHARTPNGSSLSLLPDRGAGGSNPMTQAGDASIIFHEGSVGTGNLVIAPWNSSASGMRITNNGNIGIGEANPIYKLHIKGSNAADFMLSGTDDDGPNIRFKNSANNTWSFDAYGPTDSNFRLITEGGTSGNVERIVVLENGNVGIGTASPGYKLHVNGSVAGVGAYNALSDQKFKKDITKLEGSLEKIRELRGVNYVWRHEEFPEKNFEDGVDTGLIAQELEMIFPEMVTTAEDGTKSVAYSKMIAPLVEAIKELDIMVAKNKSMYESMQGQVEQNTRDIASLKAENEELRRENEEIKARLDRLEKIINEKLK